MAWQCPLGHLTVSSGGLGTARHARSHLRHRLVGPRRTVAGRSKLDPMTASFGECWTTQFVGIDRNGKHAVPDRDGFRGRMRAEATHFDPPSKTPRICLVSFSIQLETAGGGNGEPPEAICLQELLAAVDGIKRTPPLSIRIQQREASDNPLYICPPLHCPRRSLMSTVGTLTASPACCTLELSGGVRLNVAPATNDSCGDLPWEYQSLVIPPRYSSPKNG
jgi:hypothetical protein